MKYINKNLQIRLKGDDDSRVIEFVASDNTVDSDGTVISVAGWDLERFNKNGVIGYQHNIYYSSNPDMVIGKGTARIEDNALIIAVEFEPESINPIAEKVFQKLKFGSLNAGSVGFMPTRSGHWGDKTKGEDPDVYYYGGQELLEFSIVNIPANPNALAKRSFDEELEALVRGIMKGIEEKEEKEEKTEEETPVEEPASEEAEDSKQDPQSEEKLSEAEKLLTILTARANLA